MTRNRYKVAESDYPYLVTSTVVEWYPLLKPDAVKTIIVDSLQYLREHGLIRLHAYVIMHEHLHLILSAPDLIKCMDRMKSFTARTIIDFYKEKNDLSTLKKLREANPEYRLDSKYRFWQEGYCPKQLQSLDILQQKIDYVHLNPVHKGYVNSPEEWLWSSARVYASLPGILTVDEIID